MRPLPLRTKLAVFYAIAVSILLSGFALVYYRVLSGNLETALRDELVERAAGLQGYLRFENGKPIFVYDDNEPDQVSFVQAASRYFQLYDTGTGDLLAESPELEALGVQYSSNDVHQFAQAASGFNDLQTDQGLVRFRREIVTNNAGGRYLMLVGASIEPMHDTLAGFLGSMAWLIPTGMLLAAVSAWWIAGRALTPVAALAVAAREIAVGSLDRRLPVRGANDELDDLAREFNETLARLERAVGEMKQFTSSISHELRTPLAVLRGEAEIALMQASTTEQYRNILGSQLEEFEKLTRMINQLLTLARAESGQVKIEHEPVNISAMTHSLAEQLKPVAASKDIAMDCSCEPDVVIVGDSDWLERIILNLVDNAIKFTPGGGHVHVALGRNSHSATLEVRDDGKGIPAEALPYVFERFYRADPSRSNRVDGAGLGLSLVKWAVDQHHGTIHVESAPDKGTRVIVTLPVAIDRL
jgi:heavy metal sensor kinase